MIKKIGLALLAVLVLVVAYAAIQSPNYKVSREITINAPAEKVFPYLNTSKLADQWGPWKEQDPSVKITFSGSDAGVGSRTSWEGGEKMGQMGVGSATIVESIPNERVLIKIEYVKPMSMVQDSVYLIKANGTQSVVTWEVTGTNTFMGRLMCLFVNMDKVVGGMFEKGLGNLKKLVEAQ